jgi:hypothetical protein
MGIFAANVIETLICGLLVLRTKDIFWVQIVKYENLWIKEYGEI